MKKYLVLLCILSISTFCALAQNATTATKDFINERISIAGVSGGSIPKQTLIDAKGLSLSKQGGVDYHITSFKLTVANHNGNVKEFTNDNSEAFSTEMVNEIKNAPVGSKLFIEYIKCKDKSGVEHHMYPAEFVIN